MQKRSKQTLINWCVEYTITTSANDPRLEG